MKTMDKTQNTILDRAEIETILDEEEQFFINCHHRLPVGREAEDVVDNAYARIRQQQEMAYVIVDEIYQAMRFGNASGILN